MSTLTPEMAKVVLELISRANINAKEAEATAAAIRTIRSFIPQEEEVKEEKPKKDDKK